MMNLRKYFTKEDIAEMSGDTISILGKWIIENEKSDNDNLAVFIIKHNSRLLQRQFEVKCKQFGKETVMVETDSTADKITLASDAIEHFFFERYCTFANKGDEKLDAFSFSKCYSIICVMCSEDENIWYAIIRHPVIYIEAIKNGKVTEKIAGMYFHYYVAFDDIKLKVAEFIRDVVKSGNHSTNTLLTVGLGRMGETETMPAVLCNHHNFQCRIISFSSEDMIGEVADKVLDAVVKLVGEFSFPAQAVSVHNIEKMFNKLSQNFIARVIEISGEDEFFFDTKTGKTISLQSAIKQMTLPFNEVVHFGKVSIEVKKTPKGYDCIVLTDVSNVSVMRYSFDTGLVSYFECT